MDILRRELDRDQLEAASNLERPLLVLAGPGSGKTRLLTQRIGYIFRSQARRDFKVLALTFTNKAANEMVERLAQIPGYRKERAFVGTFHRFCQEMLQAYACYIGRSRHFTILHTDDQMAILAECLAEVGMTKVRPEGIKTAIETAQKRMESPALHAKMLARKGESTRAADVYHAYELRKQSSEVLDFNDLILLSIKLLQSMPAVQRMYQDTYEFVCIDECQDTTLAQLELIKLLVPQGSKTLIAVADEDQLIYEWNEARVENLNEMEAHYGLMLFNLNRNYRCPPDVLNLANKLIVNNKRRFVEKKKALVAVKRPTGGSCIVVEAANERDEASFVLKTISEQMAAGKGRQYGDFAVIARNRFLFESLKGMLASEEIPFVLLGDESFLEQRKVTVYLHAFNVVHNSDDVESLKHVCMYVEPPVLPELSAVQAHIYKTRKRLSGVLVHEEAIPGIMDKGGLLQVMQLYNALRAFSGGETTVRRLFGRVEELLQVRERLLLEESTDAGEKLANIEALEEFIAQLDSTAGDRSLGAFNAEVLLKRSSTDKSSVDKLDPATVKLLTIHAAKGTEYPIVFLTGLEEDTLPDYRSDDAQKMEEERRNCYVAVTRTMDQLYLSWCTSRRNRGGTWRKQPSRFLTEMLG